MVAVWLNTQLFSLRYGSAARRPAPDDCVLVCVLVVLCFMCFCRSNERWGSTGLTNLSFITVKQKTYVWSAPQAYSKSPLSEVFVLVWVRGYLWYLMECFKMRIIYLLYLMECFFNIHNTYLLYLMEC